MAWAVRDSTGYLAIFPGEPELNLFWGMWEGDSDPWEWREAFGPDPFPEQQVEDEPVEVEIGVRRRGVNEQQATVVWATRDANGQLAFFGKKPTLHEHFGIWEADADSWEWSEEFGPDPLPALKATDDPVEVEIFIIRRTAA
jgi:hypothetical protein